MPSRANHRLTYSTSLLALVLAAPAAFAGAVVPPAATQQTDEIARQRAPVLPLPSTPDFGLRLQAPERSAVPKAVDDLSFTVTAVRVEGSTLFGQDEIDRIFATAIGPAVTLSALRDAAQGLEDLYRERGYFLTRVFLPPQQVKDGTFQVQVIEGFLSAVFIDGAPSETLRRRIEAIAQPLVGKRPIDLKSIERALLTINDLPGVLGTSLLRQGAELGASEIVVSVSSLPDSHILTMNNTGPNTVGPLSVGINSTFNNPFNRVGSLALGLTGAGDLEQFDELQAINARYSMPLGSTGMIFSLGGLGSHAKPGASIRALGVEAVSWSVSPRLRMPLLRTRPNSLFLDMGVAVNRSRTTLADDLLTFDKTTVGEMSLSWLQNGWGNGTTTATVSAFHALPVLSRSRSGEATVTVPDFDDRFFKLTWNLSRIQQTPWSRVSLLGQVVGQWTNDKLPSGELSAFGGVLIGKGFDGGSITGDKGLGGLLEVRYDSNVKWEPYIGNVQFYAFVDGAVTKTLRSENVEAATRNLHSTGLGARFAVGSRGFLDLQVANADKPFPGADQRHNPRFLFSGVVRF